MSHYHVSQVKHLGAGSLIEDLQALRTQFDSNTTGAALVGIFTGLFGLASDECLLITKQATLTSDTLMQGFEVVQGGVKIMSRVYLLVWAAFTGYLTYAAFAAK